MEVKDAVEELPAIVGTPSRQTVFISHANPEDNEFAAWLGTRLIGAGYRVWSDLVRLVGGEPFWRDIGDAIKDHAAVVVLVLSRSSVTKPGVLDEIALAVATSRKLQNPRFIIPVRLDDLPFDEFPEQVIRLNAINFNGNWVDGLHRLLEALDERAILHVEGASAQGIAEFRGLPAPAERGDRRIARASRRQLAADRLPPRAGAPLQLRRGTESRCETTKQILHADCSLGSSRFWLRASGRDRGRRGAGDHCRACL